MAALLQPGRNAIAVRAYHYGCQNNYSRDARAGLFAHLDAEGADGTSTVIGTDAEWRVRPAEGWRRDVGLVSVTVGVTEVYDARADPPDWHAAGFDDTAWEPAQVIAEQMASWAYLEPRQTPMLQEVDEHPTRVVEQGEIIELSRMAADVQVPERLAAEPHLRLQHARIDRAGNALAPGAEPAVLQRCSYRPGDDPRQGVRSPYLIFDFGRQVFGFPRLHLGRTGRRGGGDDLRPGAGGRAHHAAGQPAPLRRPLPDARRLPGLADLRVQAVPLPAGGGTRHGRAGQAARGRRAGSTATAERTGSFACLRPGAQRGLAGVDRHRRPAHGGRAGLRRRARAALLARRGRPGAVRGVGGVRRRGAHRLAPAADRARQLGDGLLRAWYPGTEGRYRGEQTADPLTATVFEDPKNYPTETLYFTIITGDHQRYLGGSEEKRRLAAELYPILVRAAGWFERQRDADGVLYQLPKETFIDWMPHDMRGASFTLNVLYARFLAVLGDLAESLEQPGEAASWRRRPAACGLTCAPATGTTGAACSWTASSQASARGPSPSSPTAWRWSSASPTNGRPRASSRTWSSPRRTCCAPRR